MDRQAVLRTVSAGITALAVAAAVTTYVVSSARVDRAVAAEHRAESRPPRLVTRTVTVTKTVTKPVFGESALYGAYAAGEIQSGGFTDSAGNTTYTISDQTCSEAYAAATRSMQSRRSLKRRVGP
jgi:hypothetical protein